VPPDRRLLREVRQAYKGMFEYQLSAGQWVQWFRFNLGATTANPVYDTGPQRAWYPPITLPVLLAEWERAPKNYDDDGLYRVDQIQLVVSYGAFFSTAMPDPDPTGEDHVNDRLAFAGVLYSVGSFLPKGRVADNFLTISVTAMQVKQEELDEDVEAAMFAPYWIPGQ